MVRAQVQTVTFAAADSLLITADDIVTREGNPYILLLHEQGSSRGEFRTTINRLGKMGFNCLAVDLRNGGNKTFVSNETAKRCRVQRCVVEAENIELDIKAAIDFAVAQSNQPVILIGSRANASLGLKVATENENVKAMVALSPGEYFRPQVNIQDNIANLTIPLFVASYPTETPYVDSLLSGINTQYIKRFEAKPVDQGRGTEPLATFYEHNSEYWLELLLFFKNLL